MAVVLPASLSLFPSSPSSPPHRLLSSSPVLGGSNFALRLQCRSLKLSSLAHQKKTEILTRASSEASGEPGEPEKKEEGAGPVSIEDLPRQSKQQEKYELRMKIKLNRKLRRRRRRLFRKKVLRKKGKWPLKKVKKNKKGGKKVRKNKKKGKKAKKK